MITEEAINNWDNKPVPVKKVKYPQCKDINAPRNFMRCLFLGASGTGKSYQLVKLLKTLEEKGIYDIDGKTEVKQRIILICPTSRSDSNLVFKCLKGIDWENDIIEDYSESELLNKLEEIKTAHEEVKEYQNYKRAYDNFEKMNDKDIYKIPIEDLMLLHRNDFTDWRELEPKDPFIVHIIIDDCIGTNVFKNGKSLMTNLVTKARHHQCNVLIASQAINQIPKTIRLNCNYMSIFKFANHHQLLSDIYPNISAYLTEDQLSELYKHATDEPHNSLVIDATNGKPIFKKNQDTILKLT